MKFRRLLPICLLASSLILTSCDDLLGNLMGGANKKSDETSENKTGYQGKQGATELTKKEWELAFSLEEFALRRNCHLEVTQEERQLKMDADNGKFKIEVPYGGGITENIYMHFTEVDANNNITGTYYYPDGDGSYNIGTDTEPLDLTMVEFGIINLEYDDFKYDSSSKMYKANNYHYEVKRQGKTYISLDCSDCKVTIEDGFPKKLECDIVSGGDGQEDGEEPIHYIAEYSRYNAINVTIPENNGGDNGGTNNPSLPEIDGQEISFAQFKNKFEQRSTINYNNAVIRVSISDQGMSENVSVSASKVNGEWVSDDANFEEVDLDEMVITEEAIAEMEQEIDDPTYDLKFYFNSKNNEYIISMAQDVLDEESGTVVNVKYQIHVNQYFYLTAMYIVTDGVYEAIEIQWAA